MSLYAHVEHSFVIELTDNREYSSGHAYHAVAVLGRVMDRSLYIQMAARDSAPVEIPRAPLTPNL